MQERKTNIILSFFPRGKKTPNNLEIDALRSIKLLKTHFCHIIETIIVLFQRKQISQARSKLCDTWTNESVIMKKQVCFLFATADYICSVQMLCRRS